MAGVLLQHLGPRRLARLTLWLGLSGAAAALAHQVIPRNPWFSRPGLALWQALRA